MLFLKLIVKEHTDTISKESEDYFELSPSFSVIKENVFGKYQMKVEGVLDEHSGWATVNIPENSEAYIINEKFETVRSIHKPCNCHHGNEWKISKIGKIAE